MATLGCGNKCTADDVAMTLAERPPRKRLPLGVLPEAGEAPCESEGRTGVEECASITTGSGTRRSGAVEEEPAAVNDASKDEDEEAAATTAEDGTEAVMAASSGVGAVLPAAFSFIASAGNDCDGRDSSSGACTLTGSSIAGTSMAMTGEADTGVDMAELALLLEDDDEDGAVEVSAVELLRAGTTAPTARRDVGDAIADSVSAPVAAARTGVGR
jgi:hypothetical protein